MKGIMFTEPLFRSVISGEKTQTVQICSGEEIKEVHNENTSVMQLKTVSGKYINTRLHVGEIVYLKEPFNITDPKEPLYKHKGDVIGLYSRNGVEAKKQYWIHGNFMPEKFARYFIKITGVRCERLQDISDEDCIKEGIFPDDIEMNYYHYHDPENRYYCEDCEETGRERLIKEALENSARFGFDSDDIDDGWIREELDSYSCDFGEGGAKICDICGKDLSVFKHPNSDDVYYSEQDACAALIDHLYGKGTWERNPFVWLYDFELIN
jgi:hypothetical protein